MLHQAYAGNGKPFVYAIYAQEDKEAAGAVLSALWEKGYALWPSERFEKLRIRKAALVLFFLSPAAAASEAVTRTMQEAARRDSAMLVIQLTPTELTPTQKLLLNTQQAILKYDCLSDDSFYEKLFGAQPLQNLEVTRAQKCAARCTTWGMIATVLCAAAAVIFLALGFNAQVQEDSLLATWGFSGKIKDIEEIWVYGAKRMDRCHEKAIACVYHDWPRVHPDEITFHDGKYYAELGSIESIADLSQLHQLKKLAIAGNKISDISPLFQLKQLRYLDVTANPISSIAGIGEMNSLETIFLGFTLVEDFTPLLSCQNLKQVYIDPSQQEKAQSILSQSKFSVSVVGPLEEQNKLTSYLLSGALEGVSDQPYLVFVQTPSAQIYRDYEYQVYRNGDPIQIVGIEYQDNYPDGACECAMLQLSQSAMRTYDTNAEYKLLVTYQDHTEVYQIWHVEDKNHANASRGKLLDG